MKAMEFKLGKILHSENPVFIDANARFPVVENLPKSAFNPKASFKNRISYTADGKISLLPGDYVIPVMTYCMESSGSSPSGYSYVINKLQGSKASIIRNINLKALPRFAPHNVQILSWSIQNGLSYEEMTRQSQEIIDAVVPESKAELQQSLLKKLSDEWDKVADNSRGLLPSFDQASDDVLNSIGAPGRAILRMRKFRDQVKEVGNDYSSLSWLISTNGTRPKSPVRSWSRFSDRVFIRFITQGAFQEIGQIQIRVLPQSTENARKVSSVIEDRSVIDLMSLVADPLNESIQFLSFSALLGVNGVFIPLEIGELPIIIAALLAGVLYQEVVNWDDFNKIAEADRGLHDPTVDQLLKEGLSALQKEHDSLEKPARDLGVISKKTKDTSTKKGNETREYTKSGGDEALKKDFDKFSGEATPSDDGKIQEKTLHDGTKIVMRPTSDSTKVPTLEIHPPEGGRLSPKLRVKVRYP